MGEILLYLFTGSKCFSARISTCLCRDTENQPPFEFLICDNYQNFICFELLFASLMQATHIFVVFISRSEIITFCDQVIRERQADFKACGTRLALRDETVKVSSRRVRNVVNKLTHTGWVRLFIGVIPT